jgi:L,D-peptidoglycan transpeptidase YkuD (ErfK/YbiS/YcfS/YnhG family)
LTIFRARPDGSSPWDGRIELGRTLHALRDGQGRRDRRGDKREGDNSSPLGAWPIRYVSTGPTSIPTARRPPCRPGRSRRTTAGATRRATGLQPPVRLPYPASAERMWRDDHVYDLVVVLGHNDDPPVPGLGSAIFLHLARDGYPGTEGCVALAREDLEAVLATAKPGDAVEIVAD